MKNITDLLNEFNDAINALNYEDRGSVYMHKLDHAEDLRVELLECIDEGTPLGEQFTALCKRLDIAENKLQKILQNEEDKKMKNNTNRKTWNDWAQEKYSKYEYLYFGVVDNDQHSYITINYDFDQALGLAYKAAKQWTGRTWKVEIVGVKNDNTEYLEDWKI